MIQVFLRFICLALISVIAMGVRLSEPDRVEQWYVMGNTWPPTWAEKNGQAESPGYRKLMEDRDMELQRDLPGSDERWENYMQYTQGRMLPTFTSRGFDIAKVPEHIHDKLRNAVLLELDRWDDMQQEHDVDCIYHPEGMQPKFAQIGRIAREVHEELLPYHEAWAGGIKLKPTSAYGVRLYQNGSSLVMHHDKVQTHVISSIVHIIHDGDNWPIEIESHDTGKLHSLKLQPGEMLFYESAKCLHGRMTNFNGKYYGSIFLHYQPVDPVIWPYKVDDVIANVPPHWSRGATEKHGSRWAGQSITVNSRVAAGAPPRVSELDPSFHFVAKGKHVSRERDF